MSHTHEAFVQVAVFHKLSSSTEDSAQCERTRPLEGCIYQVRHNLRPTNMVGVVVSVIVVIICWFPSLFVCRRKAMSVIKRHYGPLTLIYLDPTPFLLCRVSLLPYEDLGSFWHGYCCMQRPFLLCFFPLVSSLACSL